MTTQPEAVLENKLIAQLKELDYSFVKIPDEETLLSNLKVQLEKFNNTGFSDREFAAIINHLSKGNVFAKAKTLRDRFQFNRDDGESVYVNFFNSEEWNKNIFQVTNQVTIDGVYKNRYNYSYKRNPPGSDRTEKERAGTERGI